jgi:hypothetical protein
MLQNGLMQHGVDRRVFAMGGMRIVDTGYRERIAVGGPED